MTEEAPAAAEESAESKALVIYFAVAENAGVVDAVTSASFNPDSDLVHGYTRTVADWAADYLARAIAFLQAHADELGIDMTDYSLWGGSAGARMAAWLGSYGTI